MSIELAFYTKVEITFIKFIIEKLRIENLFLHFYKRKAPFCPVAGYGSIETQ